MVQAIPEGMEGFIPHLICSSCDDAIEFYKNAFDAKDLGRIPTPDGKKVMHAAISIMGRMIFLADDMPEFCNGEQRAPAALGSTSVTLHQYVEDCDATIAKAEQAGATVKFPAQDMFWGDRYGVIIDPQGHSWAFATHIKDQTPEETQEKMLAMFAEHP